MKKNKYIAIISQEIFQYSLLTYLILLLAETIKEGFVSYFFNLNILLVIVLLSGIAMVITHDEKTYANQTKKQKMTVGYILYTLLLSFGGAVLVFAGTYELGTLAFFVAGITAVIIFFLSLLLTQG